MSALIVIVFVLVGVGVWMAGRSSLGVAEAPGERGPGGLRRFFVYAVLLATLILAATGLTTLLTRMIQSSREVVSDTASSARGLAFLLIGGAVFFLLGRSVLMRLDERERRAGSYALYLAAAMGVALVFVMVGASELIENLGTGDLDMGRAIGGAVWVFALVGHWRLYGRSSSTPLRLVGLPLWFGSGAGLAALAAGVGGLLVEALRRLYEAAFAVTPVVARSGEFRRSTAWLVVGALVWLWYWQRNGARRQALPSWNVYVIGVGVLGGTVASLVAGGLLLFSVLEWFFGDPAATAAQHFEELPTPLASLLVGLAVFGYHRWALAGRPDAGRSEAGRAYRYLLAAAGLLASVGAVSTLVVAGIEVASTVPIVGAESGARTLLAAVTLIIIGAPLWWAFWRRSQGLVLTDPRAELASVSRRIYLTALFGLTGVAALVSLLFVAVAVFEAALGGGWEGVFYELRVALGVLASTVAVALYHWLIFRKDREARAAAGVEFGKRRILLVTSQGADLAEELGQRIGANVERLERAEPELVRLDVDSLVTALGADGAHHVMVLARDDGTPLIIPLR
jgi:hypothetical protein